MRAYGGRRAIDRTYVVGLTMTTHDSKGEAPMDTYLGNKHGAGVDIGSYNPEAAREVDVEQVRVGAPAGAGAGASAGASAGAGAGV